MLTTEDPSTCEEGTASHCTFAVTGENVHFQAIYLCQDCSSGSATEPESSLCICESCADSCHLDHDVRFLGMGEAYCDCDQLLPSRCSILRDSKERASILGMEAPLRNHNLATEQNRQDLFQMYELDHLVSDTNLMKSLRDQAHELIRHSKDTFWLSEEPSVEQPLLEKLAWKLYLFHLKNIPLSDNSSGGGCEWWVQVKSSADADTAPVDLHYDKDEVLAEHFGLGVFPALSTVTYLSGDNSSSPTIIFSRKYDEENEEDIPSAFVSIPEPGKHIVFDGSLLHGAPANQGLKYCAQNKVAQCDRITFLVNVWCGHHPAGVQRLPQAISSKLSALESAENADSCSAVLPNPIDLTVISGEAFRDESEMMRLPFVGSDSTWGNETDDENRTYVLMPPLPSTNQKTYRIDFDPSYRPCFAEE